MYSSFPNTLLTNCFPMRMFPYIFLPLFRFHFLVNAWRKQTGWRNIVSIPFFVFLCRTWSSLSPPALFSFPSLKAYARSTMLVHIPIWFVCKFIHWSLTHSSHSCPSFVSNFIYLFYVSFRSFSLFPILFIFPSSLSIKFIFLLCIIHVLALS